MCVCVRVRACVCACVVRVWNVTAVGVWVVLYDSLWAFLTLFANFHAVLTAENKRADVGELVTSIVVPGFI